MNAPVPSSSLARRGLAAGAIGTLLATVSSLHQPSTAIAYEWQTGPGGSCPTGLGVAFQTYIYGDWNLYSNYGREAYQYNIPQTTKAYAFAQTSHNSISSTAAEAGDAGGWVVDPINTDCGPK